MEDGVTTLRARTRELMRLQVLTEAWLLFERQGFEATTVDQIAEACGMSKRTFFRYVSSKEELVLERFLDHVDQMVSDLRERPLDEPLWKALRAAFTPSLDAQLSTVERTRVLFRMMHEPVLRGAWLDYQRQWQERAAPLLASRLTPRQHDDPVPDPRATAIAGAAFACLEAAQAAWVDDPSIDLAATLTDCMSAVAPL